MKEILDQTKYDQYKSTMALHLTPNTLCNRGRFCCAFCEMIFTDQWSLEKVRYSCCFLHYTKEKFFLAFTFARTSTEENIG